MRKKECIAMLLAGGQGSRLGALTSRIAKPAVAFGGKYRIIDFSLSNCVNSNIDTVGVLIQYRPLALNAYLGTGAPWDLDEQDGGVFVLPPYATQAGGEWYAGTADSVLKNLDFIDNYDPEYVLIISGDHLYTMDYNKMLEFHKQHQAELTVSVIEVPLEEASRFGIITAGEDGEIQRFTEKPKNPDSTLASMGIYIFDWPVLRSALQEDAANEESEHDFGKNVIPMLLAQRRRLFAYPFSGYWRDVGTIDSYYEANMDLLAEKPEFDIFEQGRQLYSNANIFPPHYVGEKAVVQNSLVCNGCTVLGEVRNSILSTEAYVGPGAKVEDAILLPGARVESGARVMRAIVGERAVIETNAYFGSQDKEQPIVVVGDNEHVADDLWSGRY
ncbi:MAG: glucose-1-phosphate adenylyltransferase [Peptococcaceae bacterium]|jgi:glucose-1-phosphate adenylyltransferase|nr:glucose-1-phosphate adenylyltransferase [Peptococcaceae bacterium]